ncbi:MAG: FAD-dependent oxidoreductase [Pseudolabrys sp.]|nr:FAD-dependent oxidoreductase [Pseudolabrys sp.]
MALKRLDEIKSRYDIIVLGAGAAGLSAAVFASIAGKRTLLVEHSAFIGGTTALSAGTTWIPNSRHSASIGAQDSFENARLFLNGVVGSHSSEDAREAFLRSGPRAIELLERQSDVHFRAFPTHPDYEQDFAGATLRGRALEPMPFDGRLLGRDLHLIHPPIPEFTIFKGMMVDRTDIQHLLRIRNSSKSFWYSAKILFRHLVDRITAKRGTRLVMGTALVGRLLHSLQKRQVDLMMNVSAQSLVRDSSGVQAVVLEDDAFTREISARDAIILAGGGFNRHPRRRGELLQRADRYYSATAIGNTGSLQDLALEVGGSFDASGADAAYWAPVSVRSRRDGSLAVFPHFILDRSKPGTLCVDQTGRRFVNESISYHAFVRTMFAADRKRPCIPCFIIADHKALITYGLGMVRMGGYGVARHVADGYLVRQPTIPALAQRLGIEPANLERTVATFNEFAATGEDREFGRGTTPYQRANGDAESGTANPTLGAVKEPPFYAMKLYPGDIGAAAGLATNTWGQVLGANGTPIARLYACGNDAKSVMGGMYPGPGITIGPAITFAYRAVCHASGATL